MKKAGNIHGLDSLDKEIYRLRLKAAETEKKLDDNISRFRKNAGAMFTHSFFTRKKTDQGYATNGEKGYFGTEKLNSMISKISDRITERAAGKIDDLLDRIFQKRK